MAAACRNLLGRLHRPSGLLMKGPRIMSLYPFPAGRGRRTHRESNGDTRGFGSAQKSDRAGFLSTFRYEVSLRYEMIHCPFLYAKRLVEAVSCWMRQK